MFLERRVPFGKVAKNVCVPQIHRLSLDHVFITLLFYGIKQRAPSRVISKDAKPLPGCLSDNWQLPVSHLWDIRYLYTQYFSVVYDITNALLNFFQSFSPGWGFDHTIG